MKITKLLRAERGGALAPRSRSAFSNAFTITVLVALLLSACASSANPTPLPTVSLDGGNTTNNSNTESSEGDTVTASAIIVPMKDAQLAFSAVGRVTSVNVNVGDQVSTGDVLVELDTTLLEARVREAEANLTVARVQVDYLKRVGTDEVHLQSAQAEVDRAQALVDSANATLAAQSRLVAPFDGTIASIDISPAETVTPGREVIIIADLSSFQIETTDLSERDIPRVQVGQVATVFIEALNQEFSGRVIDISRVSSTVGGDVVFTVTIDLDQQPQGLLWGMSADVKIDTGT